MKMNATQRFMFILLVLYLVSWAIVMYFPKRTSPTTLRSQYFVTYNSFSEAIKIMQRDEFDLELHAYKNKNEFVKSFKRYFDIKDFCNTDETTLCLKENDSVYHTLVGDPSFITYDLLDAGQFVLANNTLIMMHNSTDNLWIYADLNGIKYPPNRVGVDVFVFTINKYSKDFRIIGEPDTPYQNLNKYCNLFVTGLKFNGFSCSYAAALKTDYFDETFRLLNLK